jgi:hypothetical protein
LQLHRQRTVSDAKGSVKMSDSDYAKFCAGTVATLKARNQWPCAMVLVFGGENPFTIVPVQSRSLAGELSKIDPADPTQPEDVAQVQAAIDACGTETPMVLIDSKRKKIKSILPLKEPKT